MTDDEIITALQCCNSGRLKYPCEICPLRMDDCEYILPKRALDIINQQKAEIERLRNLTKDIFMKATTHMDNIGDKIKSEAIKEFAERLKNEMRLEDDCQYDCMGCLYACKEYVPMIDNLVKEMTDVQENGNK